MTDLTGKQVAVVGGSSGMGLGIAIEAARLGATVTLLGRDEAKLAAAARQVGSDARTVAIDLRNSESVERAAGALGALDHLVISAGTFGMTSLADSGPDLWRGMFEERLIGPLTLIKALSGRIAESITLFSGMAVRRPAAGVAVPAAAIAGVEVAAKALALELSPVRVNVVAPGMVDTPLLDGLMGDHKGSVIEATAARLPVRRVGTPEDVAQATIMLMTNRFMTGTTIEIDGGGCLV